MPTFREIQIIKYLFIIAAIILTIFHKFTWWGITIEVIGYYSLANEIYFFFAGDL
jgi:ABC-type uncharacterized transport system permease subunit